MSYYGRIMLLLVACTTGSLIASEQESSDDTKVIIEFRWIEDSPIQDLTDPKGIPVSCGGKLAYLHSKPVLTSQDITRAVLHRHNFLVGGRPFDLFTIDLQLSDEAREKLAMATGEHEEKRLAIVINGEYLGTNFVQRSRIPDFVPSAGFISSKTKAERILSSVEKSRIER